MVRTHAWARAPEASLSLESATLSLLNGMAGTLGMLRRQFVPDRLVAIARRQTGLSDFGDAAFEDPLRRLLESCVAEADLSVVGRLSIRWEAVRFLSNLLRLREAERRDPAILGEPVAAPIFITGLPRSGTTFLHRLMMADPANRAPLVWETIYPYPLPADARRGVDRRVEKVQGQLRAFERIAPEFRSLHPLEARSPQECGDINAHVFRSLRFETTYNIPSYRRWLDADGHVDAYRFHKRFLQHLQHQPGQGAGQPPRWVLKCPDHVFALDAIRAVYPDARLVFVHRDPVKVLLSVTRLTEVLRQPFTRRIDQVAIGRQESARWLEGARRMMAVGDDAGLPEPVCHVHHMDLVSDPVATVQGVYRHFGLALPEPAAIAIDRLVAEKPNGGYGKHSYRFEDHGLDGAAERAKFRDYMLRFGIATESTPPPGRSDAKLPEGLAIK